MTSSDRDILISINGRLERIELRLDRVEQRLDRVEQRLDRVEQRLTAVEQKVDRLEVITRDLTEELHLLNLRVDDLQLYGGWILAAITLMITFSSVIVPVLNLLLPRTDKPHSENTRMPVKSEMIQMMRDIVREELAQSLKRQ